MSIVSLPLTNQLTNGTTADGGQVLSDLNSVASQVNANAAKNGVNSDITQLTALTAVPANVTATGWTFTSGTINTSAINGGTITGTSIDSTTTGVTQTSGDNSTKLATTAYVVTYAAPLISPALTGTPTAPTPTAGDSSTKLATTQFVQQTAFSAALPAQSAGVAGYVPITNGSTTSWGNRLDATIVGFKDHSDATKQGLFSMSGLTTGNTRTVTWPDKNGTMAMTSDLVLTVSFSSAAQTITVGGALTIAHGLGVIPKIVVGYLTCVTGEQGYTAGDVLVMPTGPTSQGGASSYGVAVVPDATNLNVRYGSNTGAFWVLNKSTGTGASITPANWTFSMRAFA